MEIILKWLSVPTFIGFIWMAAMYVFSTKNRLRKLEISQTNVRKTITLQIRNYGEIFSEMAKGKKAEELLPMLFKNSSDLIEATFEAEERHQNPLTKEELNKLKYYTNTVKAGGRLELAQAKDFETIAQKLANDKPDDQGAIILLFLAAFALGLLLGSSK